MNNGLLQVLVEEDSGYVREGKNWGRSQEHSSLVVNEEQQKWFWNSEERGGGVLDYLIYVRGLSKKSALEVLDSRGKILSGEIYEEREVHSSVPYEKLVDLLWELGKGNRDYWYSRKLTDKTIDRYRLGFFDGWNLIPLERDGVFVNFQCRRDEPERRMKMWYKIPGWKPVLVNSGILQIVDTIFMTEGPVDALLLNQEGIPAVSHTGGAGYWGVDWFFNFNRIKKVYYIRDHDEAGLGAARKIARGLGMDRVLVYDFEGKADKYDIVDYFKEGGNALDLRQEVERDSKHLYETESINKRRNNEHRNRH